MTTNGATPTPCDPEILEKGQGIGYTADIPSADMEDWVKKVREKSGERVDWHFMGGRAVVRVLGDTEKVKAIIKELLPELETVHKREWPDSIYKLQFVYV